MSDVDFRLTVTRDPTAKAKIAKHEAELKALEKRVAANKVAMAKAANRDMNRVRGLSVQAELLANKKTEAAHKLSLAKRLQAYKAEKAAEVQVDKTAEIAKMRNRRQAGLLAKARYMGPGGGGSMMGRFTGTRVGGAIGGLAGQLAPFAGPAMAIGTAAGAINFGKQSINEYADFQQQQVRLEALTGSARAANDAIKDLRSLSLSSGLGFDALAQATNTMAGFGVEIDDSLTKLKQLAAIAGGDTQRMQRLALAFAQAAGNGRLMGEELNQMIDAGFNPLMDIARRTGMSVQELRKEMAEGRISIEMLSQAFEDATTGGGKYATMLQSMENSTKVHMGKMAAEWKLFRIEVGKTLSGTFTGPVSAVGGGIATGGRRLWLKAFGSQEEKVAAFEETYRDPNYTGFDPGNYARNDKRVNEGQRANRLDEEQAVHAKRLKKIADDALKLEEAKAQQKKDVLESVKRITTAEEELYQKQKKAAKELFALQRERFDAAAAETKKARDALLSARERFGGMSAADQRATVQTVLKARSGGRLSLEDIGRLKSLGTSESGRFASGALVNRSGGGFGGGIGIQQAVMRQEFLSEQRRAVLNSPGRGSLGFVGGRGQARLAEIDMAMRAAKRQEVDLRNQDARRSAIRNSLFGEESRALTISRGKQASVVNANVKQQVEFTARFENTSKQMAEEVMRLYNLALDERMKKVLEQIQPLVKQARVTQQRNKLNNPGLRGV